MRSLEKDADDALLSGALKPAAKVTKLDLSGNAKVTDGVFASSDVLARVCELRVAKVNVSTPTLLERLGSESNATVQALDTSQCEHVKADELFVWASAALSVQRVRLPTAAPLGFNRSAEAVRLQMRHFNNMAEREFTQDGIWILRLKRGHVILFLFLFLKMSPSIYLY